MEAPEEFTGSNDHTLIAKGKRTKRQRPSSPSGAPVTSSSSSGGGGGRGGDFYSSIPSPTTSGEISTSTEEDQDMANCLILLAQGVFPRQVEEEEEEEVEVEVEVVGRFEKFSSARFTDMVAATTTTTTTGKARFYVYECKTCNRTFPSFQALGGHRASHKRPKAIVDEKRVLPVVAVSLSPDEDEKEEEEEEEEGQFNKFSPPLSLPIAIKASSVNNKPKVHECSVCGLEFSSGQALGGHMRRHRAPLNTRIAMVVDTSSVESQKESDKPPRNILSLDLNLPAPPEDDDEMDSSKFQFTPNKQHLVFSSPALVDCHY